METPRLSHDHHPTFCGSRPPRPMIEALWLVTRNFLSQLHCICMHMYVCMTLYVYMSIVCVSLCCVTHRYFSMYIMYVCMNARMHARIYAYIHMCICVCYVILFYMLCYVIWLFVKRLSQESIQRRSQRDRLVKIKVFKLRRDADDIPCNITL